MAAQLPAPSSCSTNVTYAHVQFAWAAVDGAQTYTIHRDGIFLTSVAAPTTTWTDTPAEGEHEYCVEDSASGFTTSNRCCSLAPSVYPPAAPVCAASWNLAKAIFFHWKDVVGETQYAILRDSHLLQFVAANETTYLDTTATPGYHLYCVRANNLVGSSGLSCATGFALEYYPPRVRLSWHTCDPQTSNQLFQGPGTYTLVVSVIGLPVRIAGNTTKLTIHPILTDAWRFDDGGCQTDRMHAQVTGLDADCPGIPTGDYPLFIIAADYDLTSHSLGLHLETQQGEAFDPALTQRYVLWRVAFDHSHSMAGSDSDPATCDGAERSLEIDFQSTIHDGYGGMLDADPETGDAPVRWNGPSPVGIAPTTWGRVKALYR